MCAASNNCEKFTKNPFLEDSRSFKVIDVINLKSVSPVLVMISSTSVPTVYLQPFAHYPYLT